MPNGTVHVFVMPSIELERLVASLPDTQVVAGIMRVTPAEFAPLDAADLLRLLAEHPEPRVVVVRQDDFYELRLVPPIVLVQRESPMFPQLESRHPGGLYILEKDVLDDIAMRLQPGQGVGARVIKDQGWEHQDVSAATLLTWCRSSGPRVTVMEQDAGWYMLVFESRGPDVPRLVSIGEASMIYLGLRRLQAEYSVRN